MGLTHEVLARFERLQTFFLFVVITFGHLQLVFVFSLSVCSWGLTLFETGAAK